MAEPSFAPQLWHTSLSLLFCLEGPARPCSVGPAGLPKVTLNLHSGGHHATYPFSVWLSHLTNGNAQSRTVPTEVLPLVLREAGNTLCLETPQEWLEVLGVLVGLGQKPLLSRVGTANWLAAKVKLRMKLGGSLEGSWQTWWVLLRLTVSHRLLNTDASLLMCLAFREFGQRRNAAVSHRIVSLF